MVFVDPWPKPKLEDCFWYHTVDLPSGETMNGQWDLRGRFVDYTGHVDLHGKRLLDIGTASGFLSWEAERAGAEVVSFDLDHSRRQRLLPFKDSIYCVDRAESERQREVFFNGLKSSYWYMHHSLRSKAKVFYGDIENLPRDLGHFDVALFGSVLEHLPDHIQPIGSAALLSDMIIITGPMTDSEALTADFAGHAGHPEANYSFWRYSLGVYQQIFAMVGFRITNITRASYHFVLENQEIEIPTIIACRECATVLH
jgi:SAM-dependent methyltransferase